MRKRLLLLFNFCIVSILLLSACGDTQTNSTLTISPHKLSEEEKTLINKTGVTDIHYFTLNGNLPKEKDLLFEIETFENGKSKSGMKSSGFLNSNFNDSILSFGINFKQNDRNTMDLMIGTPSGLATQTYEPNIDIQGHSFQSFIHENKTLKLNQPVYLAGFIGTKSNSMKTLSAAEGDLLRDEMLKKDLALVLKVTLVNKENH
ncbi:hypothetical protein SAMN05421676_102415 [Salinibacillus kushneri]|uniref:Lipoprotein n=1 Tax=Salinibacillus kushneri TaxID=237682 RepID=A0A1I0BBY1_9BACI|nr:hypothetical protein [Salinibacillus kushneri]SET04332.1 hypothetical protein SAMN05421676_102415 [Salinibacillus kushneri]